MQRVILLLFLFQISISGNTQVAIKGSITSPEGYAWAVLYGYENGEERLMAKSAVKSDGSFEIISPDSVDINPGVYRLVYQLSQHKYVDILLENGKEVCLEINP